MAKFKALSLLGKILKRKKRESTDTSARSPRARGFTLSSIWRKKNRTLPTDGPRPNRGGLKLLKVISRVIKKCKADKPKSAGNGDGKDDEPPVNHELVPPLQSDEATASSDNVTGHDVCDSTSSLSITTDREYAEPHVEVIYQQQVHRVVTLNMDVQSQDWDDLSTIKSSTSSLTTVTELSDYFFSISSSELSLTDDEVLRPDDEEEYRKVVDQGQVTWEGDDVGQDNGVFIWIWMIGVAVIFVLLL